MARRKISVADRTILRLQNRVAELDEALRLARQKNEYLTQEQRHSVFTDGYEKGRSDLWDNLAPVIGLPGTKIGSGSEVIPMARVVEAHLNAEIRKSHDLGAKHERERITHQMLHSAFGKAAADIVRNNSSPEVANGKP